MLREFRVNSADAPSAMFKANVALKTGMGVIKDYANGLAKLPTATTADGIFLVSKMPYPTGKDAAIEDFSDYYEPFNTVAQDELVVLYSYRDDSAFGTDQYDTSALTAAAAPLYVAVGTDGKWTTATGNSKYLFTKLYDDAGHTLAHIEVVEPGSNA